MLRVVFFDLGMTLVDSQSRPYPHVKEALETIQAFTTADGQPLATCLVSDFLPTPPPPLTVPEIDDAFRHYLAILDGTGLRRFFEPVRERTTISTQAGVRKPDRKIFDTALARLGSSATLDECLLVTEDAVHIAVARTQHRMHTLRFRSAGSSTFDFDDWLQAPAMIAHLIDPPGGPNLQAAIAQQLAETHGFELESMDVPRGQEASTIVRGTIWRPVGPTAGEDLADVYAPFPVEGVITRDARGKVDAVQLPEPSDEEIAAAANNVRSLARHGQVAGVAPRSGYAATHTIETDDKGRRKLVRKGFSAV